MTQGSNSSQKPSQPDQASIWPSRLGTFILGMLVCWLLNLVQLGVGVFIFSVTDRQMPAAYVLIYAIGLVQVGYVVPLWRFLRRRQPSAAAGLLVGAGLTCVLNLIFDYKAFGSALFHFWR
jgi:membrane protein YdbS with pleckstrin-like domain